MAPAIWTHLPHEPTSKVAGLAHLLLLTYLQPLYFLLTYLLTSYLLQLTAKVVDLASWAMLHLWAGAERTREFVAPLLHVKAAAA